MDNATHANFWMTFFNAIVNLTSLFITTSCFAETIFFFFLRLLTYVLRSDPQVEAVDVPPCRKIDSVLLALDTAPLGSTCRICFEEPTRPMMIKQGGHIFCDTCIRSDLATISHCPLDARVLFASTTGQQALLIPDFHLFKHFLPGLGAAMLGSVYLLMQGILTMHSGNSMLRLIPRLILAVFQRLCFMIQVIALQRSTRDLERALGVGAGGPLSTGYYGDWVFMMLFFVPWKTLFFIQATLLICLWAPLFSLVRATTGEGVLPGVFRMMILVQQAMIPGL